MSEQVTVDKETLETLTNYVSDDLQYHMDPEFLELEEAVREAYNTLEN